MSQYVWGNKETQFFYQLDPLKILDSIDELGLKTTGRSLALNSMENKSTRSKSLTPSMMGVLLVITLSLLSITVLVVGQKNKSKKSTFFKGYA